MRLSEELLNVHPRKPLQNRSELVDCIDAAADCQQTCISCADACLSEANVANLIRCIRIDQDCADICDATSRLLGRQAEPDSAILGAQLRALATACSVCATECEKHASMHEHCRICADACRRCEVAANRLLNTFGSPSGITH